MLSDVFSHTIWLILSSLLHEWWLVDGKKVYFRKGSKIIRASNWLIDFSEFFFIIDELMIPWYAINNEN